MQLTDSHVHFHFDAFDADREEAVRRARDAGVTTFIEVGTDVEQSRSALQFAKTHDGFYSTAGIHPHDAAGADGTAMAGIEALLADPKVVAIGEVGLDFYREHSPHDVQKKVFEAFLEMQERTGKPLVIHCRDAYDAMFEILKKKKSSGYRGVMHCYSSDRAVMEKFLELGFHISFAGPLTYKKNDALRDACRACPEDRLLLETDAPYLPPQSMRGKRNESAYMIETAKLAAQLKDTTLEKLAQQISQNAKALFGI